MAGDSVRQEALACAESLLAQLEQLGDPGPRWREDNGGWTTESRAHWLRIFADVRDRLVAGDSGFENLGRNLVRLLDHDGVIGGPIAEDAATLQRHLLHLSVSRLLLYDATLHVRRMRLIEGSLSVGERVDDELGDFVVMRIDSVGGSTTYHAVRSAAWDEALQAFRDDPRSAMEDAMAHVWEYLPSTGARGQPEPGADPRFDATFKVEDQTEDGETIGPFIVSDSVSGDVVWESSEWLRLSEARSLAETKGWQFYADGMWSSARRSRRARRYRP